jgi:hypothetical protein
MAGVAIRQPAPLRWNELLRAGLADYGRMGRALVWGLVLLALAMALGNGLTHLAERRGEHMVLESDALFWERLAQGLTWCLALLAVASAEAGPCWCWSRVAVRPCWPGGGGCAPCCATGPGCWASSWG